MRPASQAFRPASTARRMASASERRVLGFGDGGVDQYGVIAQFHSQGGVGGAANAGVYDEGPSRQFVSYQKEAFGVFDALAASDRGSQGHHRIATGIGQSLTDRHIVRRKPARQSPFALARAPRLKAARLQARAYAHRE